MTLAALPRSPLHLQFLMANGARPDVVLYREPFMAARVAAAYPGRGVDLGRERVPGRDLLHDPLALLRTRRGNRAYYAGVAETMAAHGIDRLILFLEGEPLERFMVDQPAIRAVELWEDGLSHYVDLTGRVWYAVRGAVQAGCGFYPRAITRRRMDRAGVVVRDRFERGNLTLPVPGAGHGHRREVLMVGSPLVEDRILSRRRFAAGMTRIVEAAPVPVRYLPHPREDRARLARDAAACGFGVEADARGMLAHAGDWSYAGYVAAVSTGLLDLGRFERSLFVPGLFGLRRMEAILAGWAHNPVPVTRDLVRVRALAEVRRA